MSKHEQLLKPVGIERVREEPDALGRADFLPDSVRHDRRLMERMRPDDGEPAGFETISRSPDCCYSEPHRA